MKKKLCFVLAFLLLSLPLSALASGSGDDAYLSVLLIGQDTADKTTVQKGAVSNGRADAIVLAVLHLETGDVRLLSIDRDYRIDLPQHGGETKLAIANFFGGPELVIEQVNTLLGTNIKRYALIDISAMGKVVGKLGSVEIEIREEDLEVEEIRNAGIRTPGVHALKQSQVIAYMRSRQLEDTASDVGRNERQRIVLEAIIKQVFSRGFEGLLQFAEAVLPLMESNLSLMEIMGAATRVFTTGLGEVRQGRTPEAKDRFETVVKAHIVVYARDMDVEIDRVHQFLYGK